MSTYCKNIRWNQHPKIIFKRQLTNYLKITNISYNYMVKMKIDMAHQKYPSYKYIYMYNYTYMKDIRKFHHTNSKISQIMTS